MPPTGSQSDIPREFPSVPAPPAMLDHSLTLQAIMELQKLVAEIGTKTDRLIKDVEGYGNKIDAVRQQISFVKGALWVIGSLVVISVSAVVAYLRFAR